MRRWISYLPVLAVCAAQALCVRADLPQWYLDTGAPAADTDGDGIPDAWERRTFADAAAADSGADRDGDGLTDLEEFVFGSDPRTFSTMGDGWSDKEKLGAGLGAGHRVVPAVSFAQWLDWLDCDAQAWQSLTATNVEGFAAAYAAFLGTRTPYSDTNLNATVDFWLLTRTDRPALLTVGDALTTNSFPVRAGTSRQRIRAAYGAEVSLSLDPHPGALAQTPGGTNGAWLCGMELEPCRSNTVVFADGETPPPVPGAPSGVDGILVLSRPASAVRPLGGGPAVTAVRPLRVTNGLSVLGDRFWCICSSEPPCPWPTLGMVAGACPGNVTVNGTTLTSADDPLMSKSAASALWDARQPCFQCTVTQTVASVSYPFLYERVIFSFRPCLPRPAGAYGAEERPGHDPIICEVTECGGEDGICTDGPAHFIGFSHSAVNTRNLSLIPTGNAEEDTMEHCLGLVWEPGGKTNLFALLGGGPLSYKDDLHFTAEGLTVNEDGELEYGSRPEDLKPTICRVKLHYTPNPDFHQVFDRLWVVVNAPETQAAFNGWYAQNADLSWTTNLPSPFAAITFSTNWFGVVSPGVTNLSGSGWGLPHAINSFLHHNATFEMRSGPVADGHGHQATYNANGTLIENPIAAGTADISAPYFANGLIRPTGTALHLKEDVQPFIRALQLDGNPVLPTEINRNLNRPCLCKGANTDRYVERRPVLP